MTELTPAAQAVVNAAVEITGYGKETQLLRDRLAAALRTVVEQCTYQDAGEDKFLSAERILAIADELEANN
jgi:hypothetical protein